jgi:hypothetical protein
MKTRKGSGTKIQGNKCAALHCRLKKKVNEKTRAKTNSTDNVKVVCDTWQDDNGKMLIDYKQEEIKIGMFESTKLHKIVETTARLDYVMHDMKT